MLQPEQKAVLDRAVANYVVALNALDEAQFLACFRANCVVRDPYGVSLYEGEAGLHQYLQTMQATWQHYEIQPGPLFYGGCERVVFAWRATGTAHNDKVAHFEGINVVTLEGALIDGLEAYWDAPAMYAQIKD